MSTVVEQELMQVQPNNNQIDNTSYYKLPCGKYLEDSIACRKPEFAEGSALKYYYRAGKKDGESTRKDMLKFFHYCQFLANRGCVDAADVVHEIERLHEDAVAWDGRES